MKTNFTHTHIWGAFDLFSLNIIIIINYYYLAQYLEAFVTNFKRMFE